MQGGRAIAELPLGRIEPSVRPPISMPGHAGQLPVYVIVFGNLGVGYTTGEPRDSLDGLVEGATEALGLSQADAG